MKVQELLVTFDKLNRVYLGKYLKSIREAQSMTQDDVIKESKALFKRSYLNKDKIGAIENGHSNYNMDTFLKYIITINCDLSLDIRLDRALYNTEKYTNEDGDVLKVEEAYYKKMSDGLQDNIKVFDRNKEPDYEEKKQKILMDGQEESKKLKKKLSSWMNKNTLLDLENKIALESLNIGSAKDNSTTFHRTKKGL